MKRIAVLGSGLLGGSIALAVQTYLSEVQVCLWGRREESIQEAKDIGIIEATTDIAEAVKAADIVILASPVGAMLQIFQAAAAASSMTGVIVTDVGSVKLTPRETLKDIASETGALYIGSHPMAGSEQAGVGASVRDLFQGAACVVTNDFNHPDTSVEILSNMWKAIGCVCHMTSSEEHDRVMARISHLPHALAS